MTEDLKFRLPGSLGLRSVFLLPSQGLWIALGIKYITFQIVSRQFLGFSQFLGQLLLRVFDDSENGLDWLLDFPDEFTLFGHNSPLLCCLRYWKGLPFLILFQPVCPRWSLWWLFRFWASFRIQWIFFFSVFDITVFISSYWLSILFCFKFSLFLIYSSWSLSLWS